MQLLLHGLSSVLIIAVGWFMTDRIVEPRLRGHGVDGDAEEMPQMETLTARERRGMWAGLAQLRAGRSCLLVCWPGPENSALRRRRRAHLVQPRR